MLSKWDKRFIEMAHLVASWSKDQNNKVGAVLVSQTNRVMATGFNGLPRGIDEAADPLAVTVHAELNCLTQPIWPEGSTLYVTRFPCASCASLIVQSRVDRLVCTQPEPNSSWYKSMQAAAELLAKSTIALTLYERVVSGECYGHDLYVNGTT